MNTKAERLWEYSDFLSKAISSPWYRDMLILQAEFFTETINFYSKRGMYFTPLPITTNSISSPMGLGSDSIPVKVNINGVQTYLADSMQFHLEYACRLIGKGCYYVAPSFRGEKSDETHLSQFFHSEAEIIGDLDDVIKLVEDYLVHLTNHYLNDSKVSISKIAGDCMHLIILLNKVPFPRCTLEEAVIILENDSSFVRYSEAGFRTLTRAGEQKLIQHFGSFVWVTHYDHLAVPFYQKFTDSDESVALCADLLIGVGETVGAGARHKTRAETERALKMHKVNVLPYEWYLQMKAAKVVQTAGFGMGIERFFLWLLNHNDIRDIPLLPRITNDFE